MIESNYTSERLIDYLKTNYADKLVVQDDLVRLINIAFDDDKKHEIEELAFQAKYLIGLLRIIQSKSENNEEEYRKRITSELQASYTTIQQKIRLILSAESSFIKEIFEEKYLKLTQVSLANLNKLCSDLTLLKLCLNDLKQKKDFE